MSRMDDVSDATCCWRRDSWWLSCWRSVFLSFLLLLVVELLHQKIRVRLVFLFNYSWTRAAYASASSSTPMVAPGFVSSVSPPLDVAATTQLTPSAIHRWHCSSFASLIHLSLRFLHCVLKTSVLGKYGYVNARAVQV